MKHRRLLLILLLAAVILTVGAAVGRAADVSQAAKYLLDGKWREHSNANAPAGLYLEWWRIAAIWIVFVAWAAAADWANRDMDDNNLNWQMWNPIIVGSFMATMLLTWIIPWFWLNIFLLLGGAVAPFTTYVVQRNGQLPSHQHVLTRAHLRYWFSERMRSLGVKVASEEADPNKGVVPVKVYARGGETPAVDGARLLAARQTTGLPLARKVLYEGLKSRASAVVMDFAATSVSVRYFVDGVWMPRDPLEREAADPALDALKELCGLNPKERRAKQTGKFGVEYTVLRKDVFTKIDKAEQEFREQATMDLTRRMASEELQPPQLQIVVAKAVEEQARKKFASPIGVWTPIDKENLPILPGIESLNPFTSLEPVKTQATLICQGTQGGERVVVEFEVKGIHLVTLDDIGMRAKMQEQLNEVLQRKQGMVILSALPAGGLRTTTKVVLHGLDRFVREFAAVEDAGNRYDETENIPVTTYNRAGGQSPADVLVRVFRQQPNVVVVRDLVNAATVKMLCSDIATEERMVIGTVRAKDSVEALLRVYAIEKAPIPEFRDQIAAIVSQRLVRKLCDKCKEPYAPTADVLKQLGLPADKVKAFYRPPTLKADEDKRDICRECGGVGFLGQTAIFELLVIDDLMRKTLAASPKLDVLRAAARKSGMKSLQEEGIFMVVRGATSLPELMRVLKGEKQ
jgi:type II secretory ATPase GspE/PulE/Tfp pilus assembly ATPase PilB-like protein